MKTLITSSKLWQKNLNIKLKESNIATSYQLPNFTNNHPVIIARFINRDVRNLLFQKRKILIKIRDFGIPGMINLFINENLTQRRRKLFNMA